MIFQFPCPLTPRKHFFEIVALVCSLIDWLTFVVLVIYSNTWCLFFSQEWVRDLVWMPEYSPRHSETQSLSRPVREKPVVRAEVPRRAMVAPRGLAPFSPSFQACPMDWPSPVHKPWLRVSAARAGAPGPPWAASVVKDNAVFFYRQLFVQYFWENFFLEKDFSFFWCPFSWKKCFSASGNFLLEFCGQIKASNYCDIFSPTQVRPGFFACSMFLPLHVPFVFPSNICW